MRLEEAEDYFYDKVQKNPSSSEEEELQVLISRIEKLFPLALSKISEIKNFVFEVKFNWSLSFREAEDLSIENINIGLNPNRVWFVRTGDFRRLLSKKICQCYLINHFRSLGWDCRIDFSSEEIIISYPKVSFWKRLVLFIRSFKFFKRKKIINHGPYRTLPEKNS